MAVITVFDMIFAAPVFGFDAKFVVLGVILNVVAVIAADGITAFVIRWLLPEKWFGGDKVGFAAGKKEARFLEKTGIKKWKDKIPELGMFTAFRKNKISDPKNNEYVKRYILEANYGVAIHAASMFAGFVIIFLAPTYKWCFGVPVAIVNVVYNGLSLAILRYNLPKLHRLYKINEKAAARKVKAESLAKDAETAENEVAVGTTAE